MKLFIPPKVFRWYTGTAAEYAQCHKLYGSSFANHPEVLDFIHSRFDCKPAYHIRRNKDGELTGGFCTWHDSYLAGDIEIVKRLGMERYPFCKDELILPLHPHIKSFIPIKTKIVSGLNSGGIFNKTYKMNSRRGICIAKGC